ncbi:MAG TPA: polymer-forming cytoskeletal protein [Nitrospiraceae bacterium]|nr:polymer-forming cytoskeletal protein [Nitrospiraceae bacterium]
MFQDCDDRAPRNSAGSGTVLLDRMSQEVAALLGEAAAQDMTALVGAGTEFKGVIRYNGTVRIDGKVEGEIHTDGVLLIGETAVIKATVSAGSIVSCGKIFGNVTATEAIKLIAPAVLKGSATTLQLSMEEGVCFRGSLEVTLGDGEGSTDVIPAMQAAAGGN